MSFLDIKPSTKSPIASLRAAEHPMVAKLEAAADTYLTRQHKEPGNSFLNGKADVCRDMAAKLRKFGDFASENQRGYAEKLVDWAAPREVAQAPQRVERAPVLCPKLFEVMQRHSQFFVGKVTITRRNQDSLCWIKHADCEKVVGKIENGVVTLWQRPGVDYVAVSTLVAELEADPLGAAMKYGKLSGRCCSCGRDLTDPESIERGIGPICAGKFSFGI